MADITVTAGQVGACFPLKAKIRTYIAATTITAGQALAMVAASGTVNTADASTGQRNQFLGIALNGGGAGQAIDVLEAGKVYGFTLDKNYDTIVQLSNTAGTLDDGDGSPDVSVYAGRVMPLSDSDKTKVLEVIQRPAERWS
jgi:hypothetical protein